MPPNFTNLQTSDYTMFIDKACEQIIRQVSSSQLDYHMNQTPYSIYFSIRKKFIRGFVPSASENLDFSTYGDAELVNLKKEYQKLYECYQTTLANENIFIAEIARLKHELEEKSELEDNFVNLEETKQKNDVKSKAISKELREIKDKYDKKCVDVKTLKDEIDVIKKENNSASIALKRSKKERTETVKRYEKKVHEYESKLGELIDYKNKKINEERDLKLKQRKEMKRAKQLAKKEQNVKVIKNVDENENSDPNKNDPISSPQNASALSSPTTVRNASSSFLDASPENHQQLT